jgi:hypothetical protein
MKIEFENLKEENDGLPAFSVRGSPGHGGPPVGRKEEES